MVVNLKPHQQEAVEKLGNGKILYGGTGVGKSITAMAYFLTKVCGGELNDWGSVKNCKDVIVITTAKKRDDLDWEKEAVKFGIGKERDASIGGIKLTVDSWNNIGKYTAVHDAFFIFDEQRLVGSGAWTKAFLHIAKSNDWIMLTATPGDTWLDYISVFVANGFYKNRTEFKQRHVVYNTFSKYPKVDRYLETGVLVRLRNSLLVHMPYERHTIRHEQEIKVSYDKGLFEKVVEKRWHVYDMRPIRDVAELFSVMRKVVNSDSSRLEAITKLMRTHPRLIVFYNFDYELEMLRQLSDLEGIELCDSASQKKTTSEPSSGTRSGGISGKPGQKQIPITATETRYSETNQSERLPETRSGRKTPDKSGSTSTKFDSSESFHHIIETDETTSESAWEYLLSPEGMRANGQNPKFLGTESWDSKSMVSSGQRNQFEYSGSPNKTTGLKKLSGSTTVQQTGVSSPSEARTTNVQIAEWNGHKHEPIPKTDRWVYLVQYAAGSEGWNCVETDAMVFYSPTYSYKHDHQAHGRIDRLNTPFTDLYYYRLLSDSLIDQAIMRSLKQKKSFNESSLHLFDGKKRGWDWKSELET